MTPTASRIVRAAEDLVQDTYLRAWQAWTAGKRPRRAEPWLATICLNLGRDRLRRASPQALPGWLRGRRCGVSHEPEVAGAVYLAGILDPAERAHFEEHLLACEECWGEVRTAHRGRALAESLRKVAPQPLRERVRASGTAASRR